MRSAVGGGRARVVALAVAAWLLTVGGTTTLAWVMIDRAGRVIGSTPTVVSAGSAPAVRTPATTPAQLTPAPPTPAPTTTSAPAPTTSAPGPERTSSSPTRRTATGPAPSPTRPSSRPPTRPPTPAPTRTAPAAAPVAVQRVVRVQGGEVAVRCAAGSLALRWAQPDDGWIVETGASGPTEVEVSFRSATAGAEGESQVHASCQRGEPVFAVETHGSSDD